MAMADYLLQRCFASLILDEEEDYAEVIRDLTAHLASNPSNAAALNNRAVAYGEIGELNRALADFGEAVRLAPADHHPAKNRGMLLQRMGDLPAALADLDTAVQIAPNDPSVRLTRAHARMQAEAFAGAIEDFSRAIELQPDFGQQYLDRAKAYERIGETALADRDQAAASRLKEH